MRRCSPTWVAARPVPGAAYMVSIMDSTRLATDPSISSTSRVRSLRTGSPYWRMVMLGMSSILPGLFAHHLASPGAECAVGAESSDRRGIDLHPQTPAGRAGHPGEQVAQRPV